MTDMQTPIWDFVLGYYRQQGVSEAAITLQDKIGIDVNMILFLMWMAGHKRALGADEVRRVSDVSKGWQHQVVVPIRGVRRLLKENVPLVENEAAQAYRKKIQALEIEGEQLQLNAMGALAQAFKPAATATAEEAARANLAVFAGVLGKEFPQAAVDAFVRALKEQVHEK
ncbi:MAG TPA: TIGR02444 family protein [Xanthobacteraceae bacterium]|nr:TIGR02444 family protein [Xanthobacteraceae bacterium]